MDNKIHKMKSINFREICQSDIEAIISWFPNLQEQQFEFVQELNEMINDPDFSISIITDHSRDVGWLIEEVGNFPFEFEIITVINEGDNPVNPNMIRDLFAKRNNIFKWINVDALGIRLEYRNQGVGTKAMETALKGHEIRGINFVTFFTNNENIPMLKLGQALGFTMFRIPQIKDANGNLIDYEGRIFAVKYFPPKTE